MKPILYSYFRSSASYRVRIALHLKEIDFDYQAVHLIKDGGQQNALNFKAVNPMGQVPCLVDGMNVIAQSMAIIEYIDHKWPKNQLFPKDIETRSQVVEFCEIINSGIQPLVNLKVRQTLEKDFKATEEQVKKWMTMFMGQGFEAMEKKLAKHGGQYCFGNQISAADLFLVPAVYGAINGAGLNMDQYPLCKKINENLLKLEAFKKSHPQNQPDSPLEN
ncbi:MAG: maleylacetoacetate isomerase [Bdellovibrionota bacterium]